MAGLGFFILHQQIAEADGDHRAVDGLPFAVFLEQPQKTQPTGIVGLSIAFLSGIAASSVDQHGVVGEPPIAIARATDPADGSFAHGLGQRKLQTGIYNCGGFARPRGADHHVPGQVLQVFAPVFGFAQFCHGLLELVAQLAQFDGSQIIFGVFHRLGDLFRHRLFLAPAAQEDEQNKPQEEEPDPADQDQPRAHGVQGTPFPDHQEGSEVPDCNGQGRSDCQ